MVQQVDVDGVIHEFPDEATPDMMQAALKKDSARQQFMDLTQNGILNRPIKRLREDAWGMAKNIAGAAGEGIPALLNQGVNHPKTAFKNLIAGVSSIPFNVGNAALNTPQYLAGLESDTASDFLKKYTPEIPTEKIVNATFGEPTQSDAQVRALGSLLPLGPPIGRGVSKAAVPVAKGVGKAGLMLADKASLGLGSKLLGKTDAALEANEALLGTKVDQKAVELEQKAAAAQAADEAHQQAISQSKQQLGKSDADVMEYNVSKRQQDIQNMTDEATQLQKELAGIKPAETELPQAEENLARTQEHIANAENMGGDIDANIGQFLNEGAQHDVRAAQGSTRRIQSIEDYWNNAYKTFTSNVADANFHMPETAMQKLDYSKMSPTQLIQTFGPEAFDALKKGKIDQFLNKQKAADLKQAQGSNPYLSSLMEVAPTAADTNAANFLAKYKDFRDRTFNLGKKLRDPRVEEVEKQKMQDALKEARQMQSQMKQVLDEGLGEFKPEFERVNKGYSEQVYPLRGNKFVEVEKGKMKINKFPDNIIKALRTDEEGMPLLREIIKQDPEILRNLIGQRYFSGKSGRQSIHNPNETIREYLGEMPQLNELLSQKRNANTALEQAKSNAEMAKQHHAEISEKHIESQKMQKKLDDMEADIEKHQGEIEKMKTHIDELNKTRKNKKITLKEKIQVEKEYKDAIRQQKENSQKLDEKITGLRKLYRIAKTSYKIGKKFVF